MSFTKRKQEQRDKFFDVIDREYNLTIGKYASCGCYELRDKKSNKKIADFTCAGEYLTITF